MLFGKSHINRPIRLNSGSRIAKRRRAVSRACRHILEPLEARVLLSGSFPTVIDPTANQQNTSISVTPGAQVYLYGEATGGAHANSPLANGTGQSVTDTNGNLSADLAVTNQSSNSFTTSCNYYTMIGVGVSGYTNMQALYGQNVISGPGEVNSGTYQASVSFTLSQSALVVAMGLGSSQQSLSFQGPSGLVTDYAASNATVAGGIAHADLGPGSYTITETTSVTAVGQTLDNMADLLGVYIFTGSASTVVPTRRDHYAQRNAERQRDHQLHADGCKFRPMQHPGAIQSRWRYDLGRRHSRQRRGCNYWPDFQPQRDQPFFRVGQRHGFRQCAEQQSRISHHSQFFQRYGQQRYERHFHG